MSNPFQLREARLLEIARRHFEQYGYKKTTVDGIVREAGIAKGTFFLHFKTKEALLIAVFQQLRQDVLGRFETCLASAGESPVRQLEALLRFAFEQLQAYPLLRRLQQIDAEHRLFRQILDLPDTRREVEQALGQIRGILAAGIACGEFRADCDLERLPIVLASLKFLMFHPELITADGRISTAEFVETLLPLLLRGLRADGSP